ncbi:MAG TPA: hypothetical protein VM577_00045 [Anaerovoracaceae bacterium]|nr:hypothetical protein [Anaerovoracaceae bacterium]
MIDLTFLQVYYWGAYLWFIGAFLILAVPAAIELKKLLFTKKN